MRDATDVEKVLFKQTSKMEREWCKIYERWEKWKLYGEVSISSAYYYYNCALVVAVRTLTQIQREHIHTAVETRSGDETMAIG